MFKNTYPRFSVLFLALFLFINCSKNVQNIPDTPWPVLSEREALEEFAVILSEAVTGNEEMRVFLKEEALKEFDKDNDVFYPYVKEHIFGSGRSFREELVLHEKYEHQMEAIERAIPKLTVLVPDFSWIDSNCFGIRSWDTKDDKVCVGFDDREDEHYMYHNGKYLGTLPASTFPSFPVLIVKSNERMLVTTTKSGEMDYSFVNSAFDGMSVTKGSIEEYWYNDPKTEEEIQNRVSNKDDLYSASGDFITEEDILLISPSSVQAYNEFSTGTELGAVQRDYVYYGMTKQNNTKGLLNPNMRDLIYRFRFTPEAIFTISDDVLIKDNNVEDPDITTVLRTRRGDRPTFIDAINRMWGSGRYEIQLDLFENGKESIPLYFSIAPEEIMYVEKCYRTFDWNFWGNNWSSYTVTVNDIQSKWYYPGDKPNPLLCLGTKWDLAREMNNMFIKMTEVDPIGEEKHDETYTFKKSTNLIFDSPNEDGESFKLDLGIDDEESQLIHVTYTIPTGPDDLKPSEISYSDNYIIAKGKKNNKSGYYLKAIGNVYYSVTILPIDMRNEFAVKQALLNRKKRNNQ